MSEVSLKDILEKHRKSIMNMPGVIGVGVGLSPNDPGKRCILVYITGERPTELPQQIEGIDVETVTKKEGFRAF